MQTENISRVLIVGHGGRCHAIADKIKHDNPNVKIFITKDNASFTNKELINLDETNINSIADFAEVNNIDLTIPGPETVLAKGICDEFKKRNLTIFGPLKNAAQIESSKIFAKKLMQKYNIPTAEYKEFCSYQEAENYLQSKQFPCVIKYDGLAFGKGVTIANSQQEAIATIKEIFLEKKFGEGKIIIEDFLQGQEFSLMAFVNGQTVVPMQAARDYKKVFDFDKGPNTGGMGAFSPVPDITEEDISFSVNNIIKKIATGMLQEGNPFCGVLYAGLIKTQEGIKVIEFNSRFGDPETEVVLPRLKNNLLDVICCIMNNQNVKLTWSNKTVLGVVIAAKDYPNKYKKNVKLNNLINALNQTNKLYHMSTTKDNFKITNSGGRVLIVIDEDDNLLLASKKVYSKLENINKINPQYFEDLFFRHDIGKTISERQ